MFTWVILGELMGISRRLPGFHLSSWEEKPLKSRNWQVSSLEFAKFVEKE